MASIRERTNSKQETTFAVLYRDGRKQCSDTFHTRKAAERFCGLLDLLGPAKARVEMFGPPKEETRMTVGELADLFFEWKKRDVTERTMEGYRSDYRNWIKPHFGSRVADEVDERDVQRWVDLMAETLAPKSVADRHMLLNSIYSFGRRKTRRLVTQNPCQETELPAAPRKKPKGTTIPEWRAILAAADERNPAAGDLIHFLGSVGWRFSEAIALPVKNVEQRDGRVWVNMTQVYRVVNNRQVLTLDAAKSFAGFRRVEIIDEDAATMVLRRCVGKGPDELVFTNTRGSHWNQHTFLRDTWPKLLKDAGLWRGFGKSPTPHWLRHMAVAWLLGCGVPMHEVSRYVGHGEVTTTIGSYGSMSGGVSEESRRMANRMLRGEQMPGVVVTGDYLRELD